MENTDQQIMNVPHNYLPTVEIGLTKKEIEQKADLLVDSLYSDEVDPMVSLLIAESVAGANVFLEKIRDNPKFTSLVRDLIGSSKEGFKTSSGAVITQAETGTKYDYSNDATWCKLNAAFEAAKAAKTERETFLKAVTKPDTVADVETGGFIQPPIKTSTSNYKVSLKKD